jgi:hypothetical protein
MGGELLVAMYTVVLSKEWDSRLPNMMKRRLLTYNYSVPQRFEYDLNVVHKQVGTSSVQSSRSLSGDLVRLLRYRRPVGFLCR